MKIYEVTDPDNKPDPSTAGIWQPRQRPKRDFYPKKPQDFGAPEAPSNQPAKKHDPVSNKIVYQDPEAGAAYDAAVKQYKAHPGYQQHAKELAAYNAAQQQEIAKLHASRGKFDGYFTITNPKYDAEDEGGMTLDGEDLPEYDEPDEIDVGVNYEISGEDRPATYYDPAEHAELEIHKVVDLDTGEDLTDSLPEDIQEQLEELIWDEVGSGQDDGPDYDDYYDESVQLEAIRRLSGLK